MSLNDRLRDLNALWGPFLDAFNTASEWILKTVYGIDVNKILGELVIPGFPSLAQLDLAYNMMDLNFPEDFAVAPYNIIGNIQDLTRFNINWNGIGYAGIFLYYYSSI